MYSDEELLYEVRGPKNITELTAFELKEKLKTCDTIVFSFGALENHGKHLPLGCDTFQGQRARAPRRAVPREEGHGGRARLCLPPGRADQPV